MVSGGQQAIIKDAGSYCQLIWLERNDEKAQKNNPLTREEEDEW